MEQIKPENKNDCASYAWMYRTSNLDGPVLVATESPVYPDIYLEPSQVSKMEHFAKTVNG